MKITKTQKILLIAVPLLLGAYVIYKQLKGKETYEDAQEDIEEEVDTNEENGGGDCQEYIVTTMVDDLNVREQPSTSANIIDKAPKGTLMNLKPSSTFGWMAICTAPNLPPAGYVSASYVTKKQD